MKILLILTTLILSSSLRAELYGFCFEKNVNLASAHRVLKDILLRKDKIYYRESKNCLEIELSERRKELVEKYLYRKFRNVKTYGGHDISKNFQTDKTCKISVLKKGEVYEKENELRIGNKSKWSKGKSKQEITSNMQMIVTQGLKGILKMGNEEVEIICIETSSGRYQINLFVKSGKENSESQLSTQIHVTRGTPTEIGSIVQNLKNKDKTLSTQIGIEKNKSSEQVNFKYYLTVN